MPNRNRGDRPAASGNSFALPSEPVNHDEETPKFCLRFLRSDFDVHSLEPNRQAAFAKNLQKLASSRWKDLITAPRHRSGDGAHTASPDQGPHPPAVL